MTRLQRTVCLLIVTIVARASVVQADLLVADYTPQINDRFYVGDDRVFLGDVPQVTPALDFSGVGQTDSSGLWVTMVSPSYFLSSAHYAPAPGSTVTFYENNTSDRSHTYEVADWSYQTSIPGLGPSDLYLGKLTAPIPASDNIAYYAVPVLGEDLAYLNREIYVYGLPDRVGTNRVEDIFTLDYRDEHTDYTRVMQYLWDPFQPSCAFLEPGDSGGPSFFVYNGKLTLLGIHYGNATTSQGLPQWSADSLVPFYVDQIDANMTDEHLTMVGTPVIPGDANHDGVVNEADAATLARHWGLQLYVNWEMGDFDGDRVIGPRDAALLAANWSPVLGESSPLPEPTTMALLAASGLGLFVLSRGRKHQN